MAPATKTERRSRTHQDPITISLQPLTAHFPLHFQAVGLSCLRPSAWVASLHSLCHLYRPHAASRDRFKEAAYRSSSLCKMSQARLFALGIFIIITDWRPLWPDCASPESIPPRSLSGNLTLSLLELVIFDSGDSPMPMFAFVFPLRPQPTQRTVLPQGAGPSG